MVGKKLKGWFKGLGRDGDRTIDEQMKGLDELVARVRGKHILDVGCAEGLIDQRLLSAGADFVRGIDIAPERISKANGLIPPPVSQRGPKARSNLYMFDVADANTWAPQRQYDIVLMLAVLHKLRNPSEACARFARAATELVVIRLPPQWAPSIIDARSGQVRHDIGEVMRREGFMLAKVTRGHFDEWTGYYERL